MTYWFEFEGELTLREKRLWASQDCPRSYLNRHGRTTSMPAMVEPDGGSVPNLPVSLRTADGRQTYRSDSVKCKQRYQRGCRRCKTSYSGRKFHWIKPMDPFLADLEGCLFNHNMAQRDSFQRPYFGVSTLRVPIIGLIHVGVRSYATLGLVMFNCVHLVNGLRLGLRKWSKHNDSTKEKSS